MEAAVRGHALFARTMLLGCAALTGACGDPPSETNLDTTRDAATADGPRPRDDEQVPPVADRALLRAWLAKRYYRAWACEPIGRATQTPVHARLRVCRNQTLLNPPSAGEYHVGAAAVAELVDVADAAVGLALIVRGLPDPGSKGWYFYEYAPAEVPVAGAAVEPDGTLADGYGDKGGNAQRVCAECHARAPRDFVYVGAP